MSWEPEPRRRGESLRWMLLGATIALAFVGVAVVAYMLGAGMIGSRQATTTLPPSPVLPSPTSAPTPILSLSPHPDASPTPELGTGNFYIEYILDASGSMNEALPDGTIKLTLAKDLLTEHLQAFRPETSIGLRTYGHRIDYRQEAESCQDIELIAPIETGHLATIVTWLRDFQALGMTPLAESIRQAMDDFVFEPGRINSIVMLSDGIETCKGDPCGLVQTLKAEGVNFTIHVVGLDVDQPTRDQLSCIAYTSGGTYHDARSEQELRDALEGIYALVTQGEMVAPPGVDTPAPEPATTDIAMQTATSTLAPTLAPTERTTEAPTDTPPPATPTESPTNTPPPATSTESPTDTPPPPMPTPTVPSRVLPQPIYNRYDGSYMVRGITTEFGEDYRASFDKDASQVIICQEEKARGNDEVEVICQEEFSDPWFHADTYTSIWNVRTGEAVGQEGDVIPDGVGTETATVALAGQEFEVVIKESSYRDEWVDEGNNWWEEATCTYYEHANKMTVRWTCHSDVYVLWEGSTIHVYTVDSDVRLTETNLDL